MPIMEPKTVCPGVELEDAKADYQCAKRVGQYKVSQKAIYFPAFPGTRYVPFAAVNRAVVRKSALPTTCCCGKEIPVIKVFLGYEGGEQDFLFEKSREADVVVEQYQAGRPKTPMLDHRTP